MFEALTIVANNLINMFLIKPNIILHHVFSSIFMNIDIIGINNVMITGNIE